VLVSAETVKDFQLHPGDLLRLRLQDQRTKRFHTVRSTTRACRRSSRPPRPTSFWWRTPPTSRTPPGSDAVGSFLVQTDGTSPGTVAGRVRALVGTGAQVTDIQHQQQESGVDLTPWSMRVLTKVELGFALALAAAARVALWVGFQGAGGRSRWIALGARPRQLGARNRGESRSLTAGGSCLGRRPPRRISEMS